jgi:hypothetical protein
MGDWLDDRWSIEAYGTRSIGRNCLRPNRAICDGAAWDFAVAMA